jgi:hypothetical protein
MSAAKNRAIALGLKVKNGGRWSEDEDSQLLDGLREGKSPAEIAKELPGREVKAVKVRIAKLKPSGRKRANRWTEAEELAVLKAWNDGRKTWIEIAEVVPGSSMDAVKRLAYDMLRLKPGADEDSSDVSGEE